MMELAAILELAVSTIQDICAILGLWEDFLNSLPDEKLVAPVLSPQNCRLVDIFLERRPIPGTGTTPELTLRFTAPTQVISEFIDRLPKNGFELEKYPAIPDFTHRYRVSRHMN